MHTFVSHAPCTVLIQNNTLHKECHMINRVGQPLTKILARLYGGQKTSAIKATFGEKTRQEI